MNKPRRTAIAEVQEKLRQAQALLAEASEELESIKDEEQDYLDNMPESFQDGEKGEKAQEAIDNLESAFGFLDTINGEIDEALEVMDSAAE